MGSMGFFNSQLFKSIPYPTGVYSDKTIIVTGSNVGLGKEAARHFVRMGVGRIILAVRNLSKGHAAKEDIERTTNCSKGAIEVWELDMASYTSVQKFGDRVDRELDRLDIILANAGIAPGKYMMAEDNESAITVNCVSTFLLIALVMPKLKSTAAQFQTRPTVSITTSAVHEHTTLPQKSAPDGQIFAAVNEKAPNWTPWDDTFCISKLFVIFGVRALAEKYPASSYPVTFNCVNPGLCYSEMSRDWGFHFNSCRLWILTTLFGRSTEIGSRTLVHAGSAGAYSHGEYMDDCDIGEPAPFVTSEEGKLAQGRVWVELLQKLDAIKPGVSSNF